MKKTRTFRMERTGIEQLVQWTGFVGVIVVFGLLYVWQQIQTRDLKQDLMKLEMRKALLIQENSRRQVQIARLSSQDVVETVAMEVLQMGYPVIGQVIIVSEQANVVPPSHAMAPDAEAVPSAVSEPERMALADTR